MNIKIVYFANLIPNVWEPIITEQLESLKNTGLYLNSKIYMTVISDDNELKKLVELIKNKYSNIELINVYKENVYEYPGIKTIYQLAEDNDDEVILYFHSKGITSNQHDNRRYLFKNTIENYQDYISEFKKNPDLEVAGIFPHIDGFCYYNFFWVRSSYVRNYCQKPEISDNRYIWEVWIGKEFSRKKNIITYSPFIGYEQLTKSSEIWQIDTIKKKEYKKEYKNVAKINTNNNYKILLDNYELLQKNYELIKQNYEILKQNYETIIEIPEITKKIETTNKEPVVEKTENIQEPLKISETNNTEPVVEKTENIQEPLKISETNNTEPVVEKPYSIKSTQKPVKINNVNELKEVNKPKLIKKETKTNQEISHDVTFKQTRKVGEFIEKIKNINNVFIDLSYDRCITDLETKFKKIVTLLPTHNKNENIIVCENKLVTDKNNKKGCMTLKELLFYNVYKHNEKIAGIYCNMDGDEENIIEDLLHHAFINKIDILLKVNIDIKKYSYLTNYFVITGQIQENNYILLSPRQNQDLQMVKKNMPILIIGYNQYTYISKMVKQLEKYSKDIVVVDNNSSYEPLLKYYENEYNYTLLKMDKNYGHKVYEQDFLKGIFGNLFVITDPDLELNKKLPINFIDNLVKISNQHKAGRVGFAIEISSPNIRSELTYAGMPLKLWEGRFWQARIPDNNYELYSAPIDTTFCLLNTKYNCHGLSIRVAGNFTCKHLPWYINYHEELLDDEYTKYLENNISTNFWEDKFKINKQKNQEPIIESKPEPIIETKPESKPEPIIESNKPESKPEPIIESNKPEPNIETNKLENIDWVINKVKTTELLILGNNDLDDQITKKFKDVYVESTNTKIKEILFNFYNKKNRLNLGLIYCNYDGNEEEMLEDLLYICYINKIKLLVKFNVKKWKDKGMTKFETLLKLFTVYENNQIYKYDKLDNNLLFFELNTSVVGDVYKKNITVVIIGFNQYTYIKKMVSQVEKYTTDIVILDNNSTFPELLNYYKNEYKYTLLKFDKNYGHKVYEKSVVNYLVGDIYILTDPDLEFNKKLPDNFIQEMINISIHYEAEKVGFALLIDSDDIREDVKCFGKTIKDFEKQYWMCKFYYPNHELYSAAIDTTFCLINKQNKGGHYRIAGDYVCKHLPWHKNFQKELIEGEFDYYKKNNISTNYWK